MQTIPAVFLSLTLLTTPDMVQAEVHRLATKSGGEIGLSVSSYQYEEPNFMTLKGVKLGLDARATQILQNEIFIRGEVRYAFGAVNYNSINTGSSSGNPDWHIETRGLAGKDWDYNDDVIAAYTGIGYRYLLNDGRGISSSGAAGYRRESNYLYLPIGIIYRTLSNKQARLVTTLEYDQLLAGKQISKLSDAGLGYQDVSNNQSSGYGLKMSVMYENNNISIGPYLNSWNIDQSDTALLFQNNVLVGLGIEPRNNTLEIGLKISRQF